LSIRKRILTLAGAGVAALLVAGGLGALHRAPAFAGPGQPTVGAVGCVNGSTNSTDVQFNTTAYGVGGAPNIPNISNTQVQNTAGLTPGAVAPGSLSMSTPTGFTLCGAILQSNVNGAAAFPAAAAPFCNNALLQCADDVIDPGSLTARVNGAAGVILESNAATYSWNCGSAATLVSCQGAQRLSVGLITGQPAIPAGVAPFAQTAPGIVGVVPGNSFHVALAPGSTFGIVGSANPVITVTVTWTPYPISVGQVVPDAPFTVGNVLINIVAPIYAIALSASPATIPANLPTTTNAQGSVVTAILYHVQTTTACVVIVPGALPTYTCNAPGAIAAVAGNANAFILAPGAESGTVEFTTSLGTFITAGAVPAGPSLVNIAGAAQTVSVHCGVLPNTYPTTLVPTPNIYTTLTVNSCQTVSATLVGGGAAGTANVVGYFVGDFTGATAQPPGSTVVNLTPGPIVVLITTGCNDVLTPVSLAGGSTGAAAAALASSFNVTSLWVFNNITHTWQALFFPGTAPTDVFSIGPNQDLMVCGTGAGNWRAQ